MAEIGTTALVVLIVGCVVFVVFLVILIVFVWYICKHKAKLDGRTANSTSRQSKDKPTGPYYNNPYPYDERRHGDRDAFRGPNRDLPPFNRDSPERGSRDLIEDRGARGERYDKRFDERDRYRRPDIDEQRRSPVHIVDDFRQMSGVRYPDRALESQPQADIYLKPDYDERYRAEQSAGPPNYFDGRGRDDESPEGLNRQWGERAYGRNKTSSEWHREERRIERPLQGPRHWSEGFDNIRDDGRHRFQKEEDRNERLGNDRYRSHAEPHRDADGRQGNRRRHEGPDYGWESPAGPRDGTRSNAIQGRGIELDDWTDYRDLRPVQGPSGDHREGQQRSRDNYGFERRTDTLALPVPPEPPRY